MIIKRHKSILILLFTIIIVFIIMYRFIFYTPPLFDSGRRNFVEKTIDFFTFGWYLTKASIINDYFGEANKYFAKAGWYRKEYLLKSFRVKEEDLDLVVGVLKNFDVNSFGEELYFFLMKDENERISFFCEAGKKFITRRNWEMAAKAFLKVIASNPDDYKSYYYLGLSYLHLEKLLKANDFFKKVTELKPDFADAYYQMGVIAEKELNWKQAYNLYKKTLNIKPDHLDYLKALERISKQLK